MAYFFRKNCDRFFKRKLFQAFKQNTQQRRFVKRQENRTVRENDRKLLQKYFYALRQDSHKQFVSKLDSKEVEFRAELESKILV